MGNKFELLCCYFFISSLGRYKDAVARYQAVKPLTMFHDVCGLALSLFMAGQLKDSYQGDYLTILFK